MKVFFRVLGRFLQRLGGSGETNASDWYGCKLDCHPQMYSEAKKTEARCIEVHVETFKNLRVNSIPAFSRGETCPAMGFFDKKHRFMRAILDFLHERYRCLRKVCNQMIPQSGCRIDVDCGLHKCSESMENTLNNAGDCLESTKNRPIHMVFSFFRRRFRYLKDFCGEKTLVPVPLRVAMILGTFCLAANLHADALSEAQQLAQVGNGSFGEKKFDLAAESYQKALALGKSPQLYYNLGQTYANLSKPGHALACFLKAETLKPRWELNKKALSELFEEYPGLSKPPFPWYHTIFRVLSKCTWCWSCAVCFWLFVGFTLYHCVVKKNKIFLSFAVLCCVCFVTILTLILLNKPYENLYLLPEKTVGHYAPGDNSPMRYDWAAGTCCKIRSEAADFYFVSTLNQEDGWVKKDALIPLN